MTLKNFKFEKFITLINNYIMTNSSLKFLFFWFSVYGDLFFFNTHYQEKSHDNGEALVGATVKIASLSLGTSTDLEGNYHFQYC